MDHSVLDGGGVALITHVGERNGAKHGGELNGDQHGGERNVVIRRDGV